jgi:hypothetical protein
LRWQRAKKYQRSGFEKYFEKNVKTDGTTAKIILCVYIIQKLQQVGHRSVDKI